MSAALVARLTDSTPTPTEAVAPVPFVGASALDVLLARLGGRGR